MKPILSFGLNLSICNALIIIRSRFSGLVKSPTIMVLDVESDWIEFSYQLIDFGFLSSSKWC